MVVFSTEITHNYGLCIIIDTARCAMSSVHIIIIEI